MKTRIDREHWERREYFDFFGSFGEPFWGINFPWIFPESENLPPTAASLCLRVFCMES